MRDTTNLPVHAAGTPPQLTAPASSHAPTTAAPVHCPPIIKPAANPHPPVPAEHRRRSSGPRRHMAAAALAQAPAAAATADFCAAEPACASRRSGTVSHHLEPFDGISPIRPLAGESAGVAGLSHAHDSREESRTPEQYRTMLPGLEKQHVATAAALTAARRLAEEEEAGTETAASAGPCTPAHPVKPATSLAFEHNRAVQVRLPTHRPIYKHTSAHTCMHAHTRACTLRPICKLTHTCMLMWAHAVAGRHIGGCAALLSWRAARGR